MFVPILHVPIVFIALSGIEASSFNNRPSHNSPPLHIHTPQVSSDAWEGVLARLPSWVSEQFTSIRITGTSKELREGWARVEGNEEGVRIEATAPTDALYAVNAYIREFCGTLITWNGQNLPEVGKCSRPDFFERNYTSQKIRYFGNICTFSYSFTWWTWTEWEKFIDWLSLNGFNMVLSPIGQEAIWAQVWAELGVSKRGLDEFFSGPAFLAWHRMGNVQGLGGPMSKEYMNSQLELNKKIVGRLTELGIVPVLPTFSGFVPQEFERQRPTSKFLRNSCWNGFNATYSCTSTLHPSEPEFKEIAALYLRKQRDVYGDVTNVYSADPFNESPPEHLTESDVSEMASSIYRGCVAANRECIWLLQSWTFSYDGWKREAVQAFLGQVPHGKMIILDLQAEKRPLYKEFDNFFGHKFVWCYLHNFGGNAQLRGNFGKVHEDYREARSTMEGMNGMGLTMEGINQNYAAFQYMIDLAWTEQELNPQAWIVHYAMSRYGTNSVVQRAAWLLLLSTFYNQQSIEYQAESGYFESNQEEDEEPKQEDERREIFLYFRPQFGKIIRYWFSSSLLDKIGGYFVMLNRTLGSNELFRQDYADVNRELLQYKLWDRYLFASNGYSLQDKNIMRKGCDAMDQLFVQLDQNESEKRLSDWIIKARNAAHSTEEGDLFERQAVNQVTLWGPAGEISDYARKEWKGLIRKYYAKRWAYFCDYIQSGVRYNQKKFEELLLRDVEIPFGHL